jgi:hypothetical protein
LWNHLKFIAFCTFTYLYIYLFIIRCSVVSFLYVCVLASDDDGFAAEHVVQDKIELMSYNLICVTTNPETLNGGYKQDSVLCIQKFLILLKELYC